MPSFEVRCILSPVAAFASFVFLYLKDRGSISSRDLTFVIIGSPLREATIISSFSFITPS